MFYLSSIIGNNSISCAVSVLIQSLPPRIDAACELLQWISPDAIDWETRLRWALILIKHGCLDQAEKITDGFTAADYFKCPHDVNNVKSIFAVLPYVQPSSKTLELLSFVESNDMLDLESLVGVKLRATNSFIYSGKSAAAKIIIKSISCETVTNPHHLTMLGLYHNHLSMFDSAEKVFHLAEQRVLKQPNLSVHMAQNKLCLNEFETAKQTIKENAGSSQRTHLNLAWQAKLYHFEGRVNEALVWINKALRMLDDGSPQKCFCLIEKGNELRSIGKMDLSINCYTEAIEKEHDMVIWLWVACFEYAMTLLYLGEVDEAVSIALRGCRYNSYKFNSKFNPCLVLSDFLAIHLGKPPTISVHEWPKNAMLWPFPYLPYKLWMLIFSCAAFEKNRLFDDAKKIYDSIMKTGKNNQRMQESYCSNIFPSPSNIFHECKVMDVVQSKLWPNDFNWNILRRLFSTN